MNASRSSEESKRAAEVRRQRNLLVKETQEAERNIFRKRDRSRDRQQDDYDAKRSKDDEDKSDEEESEAESGEEEESDETESGEESTSSDGTGQESVASTPDRETGTDEKGREVEETAKDMLRIRRRICTKPYAPLIFGLDLALNWAWCWCVPP